MKFADHLWLPFLDQPQLESVVFAMINFQIYHILVSKWRSEIGTIDIITFNEDSEFISSSIIEIISIDESLHENEILIFLTKRTLKMITIMFQKMKT